MNLKINIEYICASVCVRFWQVHELHSSNGTAYLDVLTRCTQE